MSKNRMLILPAGVLLFSAMAKLIDFENTLMFIREICFLSVPIIEWLLYSLIFLELMLAAWLLWIPFLRFLLYFALTVLLTAFSLFAIYLMISGFKNCGCFGTRIVSHPLFTLVKNSVMIAMLVYLYKTEKVNDAT